MLQGEVQLMNSADRRDLSPKKTGFNNILVLISSGRNELIVYLLGTYKTLKIDEN